MSEVTHLLHAIDDGDAKAADQFLPLVYEELRKLAAAKLAQEKSGQTLQATALVHEAWLRLGGGEGPQGWNSRGHFFGAAGDPGGPPLPNQSVGFRQYAVAFSGDGRFLASGGAHGKNGVQVWDVATGRKIRTLEKGVNGDWIRQVAFSGDGRRVFSYAEEVVGPASVRIHDADTGQLLDAIRDGDLTGIDLSPDFRRMAVCRNGAVSVHDLTAEGFSKVLLEVPSEPVRREVSFSPDGRRLMVLAKGDATIHDSFTGEHQLTLRGGIHRAKFSADSRQIISTDGDRRIKIWDASTNRELVRLTTGYKPQAISKDGSRLVVHLPWDETRGIAPTRIEANSGGLGVLDTATGKLISIMREHEPRRVDGAAFSPDNNWVASGGRDAGHTLRVWDARTGEVKQTISTPKSEHNRIGFGPKGDRIVSARLVWLRSN
jgi:WD40 repeat protein